MKKAMPIAEIASLTSEEVDQLQQLLEKITHFKELGALRIYLEAREDKALAAVNEDVYTEEQEHIMQRATKITFETLKTFGQPISSMDEEDLRGAQDAITEFLFNKGLQISLSGGNEKEFEEIVTDHIEYWRQTFANIPDMLTFVDEVETSYKKHFQAEDNVETN